MAKGDPSDSEGKAEQQLGKPLEGYMSFSAGPGEWHAMNAGLVLARNASRPMPWDRQVRPRVRLSSLFQEPLLGRFDGLRRVSLPASEAASWAWVLCARDHFGRLPPCLWMP